MSSGGIDPIADAFLAGVGIRGEMVEELHGCCHFGFGIPIRDVPWEAVRFQLSSATGGSLPPYVPRTIDSQIAAAVLRAVAAEDARERFVVLTGQPKSGKTRTLLHHLKERLPDAALAWVRRTPSGETSALRRLVRMLGTSDAAQLIRGRRLVVLFDDLDYHMDADAHALTATSLGVLLGRPGTIVAATCHDEILHRQHPPGHQAQTYEADAALVEWIRKVEIPMRSELDYEELACARVILADVLEPRDLEPDRLATLPELLASANALAARYDEARTNDATQHLAAYIDAAFDWWRIAPGSPVSRADLALFAPRRFHDRAPTRVWEPSYLSEAERWATRPVGAVTALLTAVEGDLQLDETIAARLTPDWRAPRWVVELADEIPEAAMFRLGVLHHEGGNVALAESCWQLAAERGSPRATIALHLDTEAAADDVQAVSALVTDPSIPWYARVAALRLVLERLPAETIRDLIGKRIHPEATVACSVRLAALGERDVLRALARGAEPEVRLWAAAELRAFDAAEAEAALAGLANADDVHPEIRVSAATLLVSTGSAADALGALVDPASDDLLALRAGAELVQLGL